MQEAVDAPESAPVWHTLAGDAVAARLGCDLIHGLTAAGWWQVRRATDPIGSTRPRVGASFVCWSRSSPIS